MTVSNTSIPDNVAQACLRIVSRGIVMARNWSRRAPEWSFGELDHIHNLPGVVEQDRVGGLAYYYNVERRIYLDLLDQQNRALDLELEPLWETIRGFLDNCGLVEDNT